MELNKELSESEKIDSRNQKVIQQKVLDLEMANQRGLIQRASAALASVLCSYFEFVDF